MAIPTLPPRLRKRLNSPVALPICSFRKRPMAVVANGTKVIARPAPWIKLATTKLLLETSRSMLLIANAATPDKIVPAMMSLRLSTLLSDQRHHEQRAEPARTLSKAALEGGVTHQVLQKQWQQR